MLTMKKYGVIIIAATLANVSMAEIPNYMLSNVSPATSIANGMSQYQTMRLRDLEIEKQRLQLERLRKDEALKSDSNVAPTYGKSGLPSNCRAYIQYSIDTYKQGLYTADEVMNGLERNCGANGQLWDNR